MLKTPNIKLNEHFLNVQAYQVLTFQLGQPEVETHFVGKSEGKSVVGADLRGGGGHRGHVPLKAIFFEPMKKALNLLREFF